MATSRPFVDRSQIPYIKLPKNTSLWATIPDSTERANLTWSTRDNNPRMTVFYPPNENGRVQSVGAPMAMSVALGWIECFMTILQDKTITTGHYKLDIVTSDKEAGPGAKKLISELHFGLDREGKPYIALKDVITSRPLVKFGFTFGDWHKLQKYTDGKPEPVTETEAARWLALGYLGTLRAALVARSITVDAGVAVGEPAKESTLPAAAPAAVSSDGADSFL